MRKTRCGGIRTWGAWSRRSAPSRGSVFWCVRSITGRRIGCGPTCSCACWRTTWNGTCDGRWLHCSSTTKTFPKTVCDAIRWPLRNRRKGPGGRRLRSAPETVCRCTASGPFSRNWGPAAKTAAGWGRTPRPRRFTN